MRNVLKLWRPNTHRWPISARATAAAWLLTAGLAGCSGPAGGGAWVSAREYFGSARSASTTDTVEVVGAGFTPNGKVVLQVADLPGYTQAVVFSVPGPPPHADSYSGLDYSFTPPCFYNVGDYPVINHQIRVLAIDEVGWAVYTDALTAQSFSCDSPPPARR